MRNLNGYIKGINLGGWLSQCDYSLERLENFIQEDDIKQIKDWGLDHVRLPFDFNILQDSDGRFLDGFKYIDRLLEWCDKLNLNTVLDLHKAHGFFFDVAEHEKGLFGNPGYEKLFLELWEELSRRYANIGQKVSFELLNEVTEPKFNSDWMRLASGAIKIIRSRNSDTNIFLGGYWNNSADAIHDLILPPDKNVIYTYHDYDPMCFTHQGAPWVNGMPDDFRVEYPFSFDSPECEPVKPFYKMIGMEWEKGMADAAFLERRLGNALKVCEERNAALYCGEYGVIDLADPQSTLNWFKDINSVFEKHNIGRAAWSYKEMNYGLSDSHYAPVIKELIRYL